MRVRSFLFLAIFVLAAEVWAEAGVNRHEAAALGQERKHDVFGEEYGASSESGSPNGATSRSLEHCLHVSGQADSAEKIMSGIDDCLKRHHVDSSGNPTSFEPHLDHAKELSAKKSPIALDSHRTILSRPVRNISSADWDRTLVHTPLLIVMFYLPWCGHSRALGQILADVSTWCPANVTIAQVSCSSDHQLCERYLVREHPTLKLFRDGVPVDYRGQPSFDHLMAFAVRAAIPPLMHISNATELASLAATRDVVVAARLRSADERALGVVTDVARSLAEPVFCVLDPAGKFDLPLGKVALYGLAVTNGFAMTHTLTRESLIDFIRAKSSPILRELTWNNFASVVYGSKPSVVLFESRTDSSSSNGAHMAMRFASKTWHERFVFARIDGDLYSTLATRLGLVTLPGVVLLNPVLNEHYVLRGSVNNESISAFCDGYVKQTLPKPDSMEVLDSSTMTTLSSSRTDDTAAAKFRSYFSENVDEVSGLLLDAHFANATTDVVVLYQTPGCGFCIRMRAVFGTVAAQMPGTRFVSVNCMQHVDSCNGITEYPTVKLFSVSDGDEYLYAGASAVHDLRTFVTDYQEQGHRHKRLSGYHRLFHDKLSQLRSVIGRGAAEVHDEL